MGPHSKSFYPLILTRSRCRWRYMSTHWDVRQSNTRGLYNPANGTRLDENFSCLAKLSHSRPSLSSVPHQCSQQQRLLLLLPRRRASHQSLSPRQQPTVDLPTSAPAVTISLVQLKDNAKTPQFFLPQCRLEFLMSTSKFGQPYSTEMTNHMVTPLLLLGSSIPLAPPRPVSPLTFTIYFALYHGARKKCVE